MRVPWAMVLLTHLAFSDALTESLLQEQQNAHASKPRSSQAVHAGSPLRTATSEKNKKQTRPALRCVRSGRSPVVDLGTAQRGMCSLRSGALNCPIPLSARNPTPSHSHLTPHLVSQEPKLDPLLQNPNSPQSQLPARDEGDLFCGGDGEGAQAVGDVGCISQSAWGLARPRPHIAIMGSMARRVGC